MLFPSSDETARYVFDEEINSSRTTMAGLFTGKRLNRKYSDIFFHEGSRRFATQLKGAQSRIRNVDRDTLFNLFFERLIPLYQSHESCFGDRHEHGRGFDYRKNEEIKKRVDDAADEIEDLFGKLNELEYGRLIEIFHGFYGIYSSMTGSNNFGTWSTPNSLIFELLRRGIIERSNGFKMKPAEGVSTYQTTEESFLHNTLSGIQSFRRIGSQIAKLEKLEGTEENSVTLRKSFEDIGLSRPIAGCYQCPASKLGSGLTDYEAYISIPPFDSVIAYVHLVHYDDCDSGRIIYGSKDHQRFLELGFQSAISFSVRSDRTIAPISCTDDGGEFLFKNYPTCYSEFLEIGSRVVDRFVEDDIRVRPQKTNSGGGGEGKTPPDLLTKTQGYDTLPGGTHQMAMGQELIAAVRKKAMNTLEWGVLLQDGHLPEMETVIRNQNALKANPGNTRISGGMYSVTGSQIAPTKNQNEFIDVDSERSYLLKICEIIIDSIGFLAEHEVILHSQHKELEKEMRNFFGEYNKKNQCTIEQYDRFRGFLRRIIREINKGGKGVGYELRFKTQAMADDNAFKSFDGDFQPQEISVKGKKRLVTEVKQTTFSQRVIDILELETEKES